MAGLNCTYCTKAYKIWTDENQPQSPQVVGQLPMLLKCGHSYCQTCVDYLAQVMSYLRCHKCSVTTQLDSGPLPFDTKAIGRLFLGESAAPLPTTFPPRVKIKSRPKPNEKKPPAATKLDDPNQVRVVKVTSPDDILLEKSCSSQLKEILSACSFAASRAPSFSLKEWMFLKPGQRLLSRWMKDETWYRWEVVASCEKLPPVDASNVRKIRVRCLDVGRWEWVSFSASRHLTASVDQFPPLCVNCSLHLRPVGEAWTPADVSALAQLLHPGRNFRVVDVNVPDKSGSCVDLRPVVSAADGLSVRQWCVLSGLGKFPDDSERVEMDGWESRVAMTASMMLFPDAEGDAAVEVYQQAATIELPDEALVKISCLDTLPAVWVTPHLISDTMAFDKESPKLSGVEEMFCPRIGGLYAAEYDDGLWYRCLVESIEEKKARVMSVDFGNHWMVDWERGVARLVDVTCQQRPFLANRVLLAGIEFPQKVQEERINEQLQSSPVYLLRYHANVVGERKTKRLVYLLHRNACANLRLAESGLACVSPENAQLMRDLVAQTNALASLGVQPSGESLGEAAILSTPLAFITPGGAKSTRECRGRFKVDMAIGGVSPSMEALLRRCDRRLGLLSPAEAERLERMPVCSIVATETPDEVYVRMETPKWQRLRQRLSAAMSQLHTSHRHPSTRLESSEAAQCGCLCAVVRPDHLDWCRGLLLRVVDEQNVEVLLIDFGDKLLVPLTYVVQPIDSSFISRWPLLASRCRLLGLAPAAGRCWSAVSRTVMNELVGRSGAARLSRLYQPKVGIPGVDVLVSEVDLSLGGNPDGQGEAERMVSLRWKLVDAGVARRVEMQECPWAEAGGGLRLRPVCETALRWQVGMEKEVCGGECQACGGEAMGSVSTSSSSAGGSGRQSPIITTATTATTATTTISTTTSSSSSSRSSSPLFPRWPQQRLTQLVGRPNLSVTVLHVDDDLTLACRLSDAGLDGRVKRLESTAGRVCATLSPPSRCLSDWTIGEACLVYSALTLHAFQWRRGQVVQLLPDSPQRLRVYLIDHAQTAVVHLDSVRPVGVSEAAQRSLFVPPIAWRCRVLGIDVSSMQASRLRQLREVLLSDDADCRLSVRAVEKDKDGVTMLSASLCCSKMGKEEVDLSTPIFLSSGVAPVGLVLPVEVTAVLGPALMCVQHMVRPEAAKEMVRKFPRMRAWIAMAARQWNAMSTSAVHWEVQRSARRETVRLQQGEICSALFSNDQLWYRAQLQQEKEDGQWEVVFVDYGNSEVVHVGDLTKPVMLDLPACACLYQWEGVKRDPQATSDSFCAEVMSGLAAADTLYLRRVRTAGSDQPPRMQLFTDQDCSISAVELLPSLLMRQ